jgi:hypothetical protein
VLASQRVAGLVRIWTRKKAVLREDSVAITQQDLNLGSSSDKRVDSGGGGDGTVGSRDLVAIVSNKNMKRQEKIYIKRYPNS